MEITSSEPRRERFLEESAAKSVGAVCHPLKLYESDQTHRVEDVEVGEDVDILPASGVRGFCGANVGGTFPLL